jgi:diacylglycerol kinase family enzyme
VTIPAFVNPAAGSAPAALEALKRADGFAVHLVSPRELLGALREAVTSGVPRVLIAGGDGTISEAASVVVGTSTALAVLPGGTLNHFARDHGIPTEFDQALEVARSGSVRTADVGYVNDQLFLNTSAVGAYIRFVRTRDRLEPWCGYWLASLVAGLGVLATLRPIRMNLEVSGAVKTYVSPLVFVSAGERVLAPPRLGALVPDGARALHVIVPHSREQAWRVARAYGHLDRGLAISPTGFGLDSVLVERFRLELRAAAASIGLDGEIRPVSTPLEYRFGRDMLKFVAPS